MSTTAEIIDTLDSLNAEILLALVHKLNLPVSSTRKQDNIAALRQVLMLDMGRVLRHLTKEEQQLVAETAYNGHGQFEPQRFTAKYGIKCPIPESRPFPASKASALLLFLGHGYGPRTMPRAVAEAVRAHLPSPATAGLITHEQLPAKYEFKGESRQVHIFESERTVFPELRAVLNLVLSGKLEINMTSGRPTVDTVRLVTEVLTVPDFQLDPPPDPKRESTDPAGAVRAHAWCVVLQQCKWAKARGPKLFLTEAGREMLTSVNLTQFRLGVSEFMSDDRFDEFNRIEHIRGQTGRGERHLTMPSERRIVIDAAMQEWPPNKWIDFAEAFRHAWACGHEFEVSDADDTLFMGEPQYGTLTGQGPALSRQYFRAVLFESLATLGLIDIAYVYPHLLWPELGDCRGNDYYCFCSRYDGLLYVRLNALGAFCLELTETYGPTAPPDGIFRVLTNREIVPNGDREFSPPDRQMLDRLATAKSASVWELDAVKILSYVESGGSVDDVVEFLESNSSAPIPEAVQFMLSDVARGAASIVGTEDAVVIEFHDSLTAALVAHDVHAAKLCYLAGNKRIAVPRKNLRTVRTAMKSLGIIFPDGLLPS